MHDALAALAAAEQAFRSGDHRAARDGLPDAAELTGDDRVWAQILRALVEARLGSAEAALARAEAALPLAEGVRAGWAHLAVGFALFALQRGGEGEPFLVRAHELGSTLGDDGLAGDALCVLGLVLIRRRELDRAADHLQRGIDLLEASGRLGEAAHRLQGLAHVHQWRGDLDAAAAALARGERCAEGLPGVRAALMRTRSRLLRDRDDDEGARALLLEALALLPVDGPSNPRSRILNDLGDVARELGATDESRRFLQEALRLREGRDDYVPRINLALLEVDAGKHRRAMRLLEPMLDAVEPPWARVYAHTAALLCAAEPDRLEAHLAELEAHLATTSMTELAVLKLLLRAATSWTGRDPHRVARLLALAHGQAISLERRVDQVQAALVQARLAGADLPLGPIALHREVGRGGMGQVWRGTVRDAGVAVAVKVLGASDLDQPLLREALRRELRAVAALDHPGIVPLVDHGVVPAALAEMTAGGLVAGTPWLATRWADGGTLNRWRGQRPWSDVRGALLQVLAALGAAHAEGLVHLDVKPANVLVSHDAGGEERLWLSDFGVARALGVREDQPVAGTPAFMAPEQCQRQSRHYGAWTDLYALGGLAVTLVQGHPPFVGGTRELLQQQITRLPPPLEPAIAVPDGLDAWCRRLLAKAPADRFRCAADAADALRELPEHVEPGPLEPPLVAPMGSASGSASSSTFVLDGPTGAWPAAQSDLELDVHVATPPTQAPQPHVRSAPPAALAGAASRLLPLRPVPCMGQEAAREALWSALLGTRAHGARAVRLTGPRGSGRSHLLDWLQRVTARTGAAWVVSVHDAADDPWVVALRRKLHTEGLTRDALDAAVLPLLETHLGTTTLGSTELGLLCNAACGQTDAIPLLIRVVQDLARHRPVLLALDVIDDGRVASVIERVLAACADLPVLVVCARALSREIGPADRVLDVAVEALDQAALRSLARALLPLAPGVDEALATTGGAASLVWTVRTLLATRGLQPGPRGLELDTGVPVGPTSPAEAIGRLLDAVIGTSAAWRRRAEVAAHLGGYVPRDRWQAATEALDLPHDEELADRLAAHGLWRADERGFTFVGAAVREVLLQGPDDEARRRIHAALARGAPTPLARARHLVHADPAEALVVLRPLLLESWGVLRPGVLAAWTLWDRALAAADLAPDDPAWLWTDLLRAQTGALDAEALASLKERAALAALPDGEALAWTAAVRRCTLRADLDGARSAALRALSLAEGAVVRAKAHHYVGRVALEVGDLAVAVEHLGQALSSGVVPARPELVTALLRQGELQMASGLIDASNPALDRDGPAGAVRWLTAAAEVAEAQGRPDLVDLRLAEARRLGPAVGPFQAYTSQANSLMVRVRQDDVAAARDHLAVLLRIAGDKPHVVLAAALLEPDPGADLPSRLGRVHDVLAPVAWGVDHEEIAGMLEVAATWPAWEGAGAGALRVLADDLRARRGRAVRTG